MNNLLRNALKFLLIGLELPLMVIGFMLLFRYIFQQTGEPFASLAALAGALAGLALGSLFLWWYALHLYRSSKVKLKTE